MRTERILLLDAWNLMIAVNSVAHIEDGNSQPIGMFLGTVNLIRTFVDQFKPTKVLFIMDGPDAGERRRQLYPNYKAKRTIKKRESKVQIMEGDENIAYGVEGAFQNQLIKIYEFVQMLPVTICIIPYCEADDIITYLALENKDNFENIIVSNDKDYLQLIQPGISVYRWKEKRYYGTKEFVETMKILPNNYIFKKILLGDTSDVIQGVKGIGKKTFEVFYEPLSKTDFGDKIENFIEFLKTFDLSNCNTRERNAISKILTDENIEKMILSYKLMRLDRTCMMDEQIEILQLQLEQQMNRRLAQMIIRVKMSKSYFNRMYNGFNEDKWLQPFAFVRPQVEIKS